MSLIAADSIAVASGVQRWQQSKLEIVGRVVVVVVAVVQSTVLFCFLWSSREFSFAALAARIAVSSSFRQQRFVI